MNNNMTHLYPLVFSTANVLKQMARVDSTLIGKQVDKNDFSCVGYSVEVRFYGDEKGVYRVYMCREVAYALARKMLGGFTDEAIHEGEMVESVISEFMNISVGNVLMQLALVGVSVTISPPVSILTIEEDSVFLFDENADYLLLETALGVFIVGADVSTEKQ